MLYGNFAAFLCTRCFEFQELKTIFQTIRCVTEYKKQYTVLYSWYSQHCVHKPNVNG